MPRYNEVLEESFREVERDISQAIFNDEENLERVEYVVRCATKSGIRAVLACSLAKVVDESIDIRKPYTEIKDSDSYSGRTIDERYIEPFIFKYDIPANQTTAWLTPAFRTNSSTLKPGVNLNGTPAKLYSDVILLLDAVYNDNLSAKDLLKETIRQLLILKKEREDRLEEMLEELGDSQEKIPLSSEEIVSLIKQHLDSPKSSRLPVLVVAAAYFAAKENLGEKVKSLHSHNAPDSQTGALGDVEITLISSDDIITSYEMKGKEVKRGDIDIAVKKIHSYGGNIDNYIFITTGKIDSDVKEYAKGLYRDLGGVEIAILNCIGFLRHFLHLFHRIRSDFLDAYQELVINEPESAVSQSLKEVFLSLRKVAESEE